MFYGFQDSSIFPRMNGSPLVRHSYRLATAGPDGLRLLIFLQPLGRALKNQNAAPTTPPCFSRWLRSSSLLFESSRRTVNRSLLLDIPTGWEPQAKQSRTVALLAALCAAALFESSRRTVNRSLLLDIPTRWEPRTKQQPAGLIACPAVQGLTGCVC